MAKLMFNGMIIEGTVEELSELMQKVGGSGAEIAEDGELKIGDYVVPLKSADDKYGVTNTEMKLGKVIEGEVDCCGEIRIEVVAHENDIEVGESYSVESKYFRKATQEEIDAALKPMLKVGDYVKLSIPEGEHPKYGWGSVSNGDVGKITEIQGKKIIVEFPAQKGWFGIHGEFVKATDEEVAKAKVDAKLAKLGRNPGEFKKGDIVRVIEDTGASTAGEIVELAEDGAESYRDKDGDILFGKPEWFELVAPVESRVDTE